MYISMHFCLHCTFEKAHSMFLDAYQKTNGVSGSPLNDENILSSYSRHINGFLALFSSIINLPILIIYADGGFCQAVITNGEFDDENSEKGGVKGNIYNEENDSVGSSNDISKGSNSGRNIICGSTVCGRTVPSSTLRGSTAPSSTVHGNTVPSSIFVIVLLLVLFITVLVAYLLVMLVAVVILILTIARLVFF
ncbi:hypothetical protein BDF21DRAFT_396886 [Thamnidium elegans]|nr:hypothetical protein BDF21DRAFT_396886 [Thamnidium elegans]